MRQAPREVQRDERIWTVNLLTLKREFEELTMKDNEMTKHYAFKLMGCR